MKNTPDANARGMSRRLFLGYCAAGGASLAVPAIARAQDPLKIAVVYPSPISEIGWVKQHSLAVDAIRGKFGDRIKVSTVDSIVAPQDAERVFRDFAARGYKLIIGTSFSHGTPLQKVSRRFPKAAFEHCSGIIAGKNLGIFEARYFEGTYIAGIAAGHMTKSGKLGFVAAFPVPDNVSAANAFLLGAQSVDPKITCNPIFLNAWFNPGKEKEGASSLVSQGCDVICGMTDTVTSVQVAGEKGVWSVGYASDMSKFANGKQLTSFMLDWNGRYEYFTQEVLDGTWKPEKLWDGLGAGVVKMAPFNKAIPADTVAALEQTEKDVASGKVNPFAGELKDTKGKVRVEAGAVLGEADVKKMDWFVQGMNREV